MNVTLRIYEFQTYSGGQLTNCPVDNLDGNFGWSESAYIAEIIAMTYCRKVAFSRNLLA